MNRDNDEPIQTDDLDEVSSILAHRELLIQQGLKVDVRLLFDKASPAVHEELERRLAAVERAENALRIIAMPVVDRDIDHSFKPLGVAGRYDDVRVYAEGSSGFLCRAMDISLNRPVAYKVLKPSKCNDPHAVGLFMREPEITSRLHHPGILPIYARLTDDSGAPAFVTEFIEGVTFATLIEQRYETPIADSATRQEQLRELLSVFTTACNVVQYAHSQKIVHGDLKPLNIIVGHFRQVRVVDWGLARIIDAESEISGSDYEGSIPRGTAIFTSTYYNNSTFASDIFSLGMILTVILSASPTRTGREYTPSRDVPLALWAVAQKAACHERSGRYASVSDLVSDVEKVLSDKPISIYTDRLTRRLRRFIVRHPLALALCWSLLLTVVVLGLIFWRLLSNL